MTFTCSCGLKVEFPNEGWMQLRELLADHRDCAERSQTNGTAGYEEAWKAGYTKGVDAGIGIGYSDAKARVFLAVDSVESALASPGQPSIGSREIMRRVDQAIKAVVGGRP